MHRLLVVLTCVCLSSWIALWAVDVRPAVPWGLLAAVAAVVPVAAAAVWTSERTEPRLDARHWPVPVIGLAAGLVLVFVYRPSQPVFQAVDAALFVWLAALAIGGPKDRVRRVAPRLATSIACISVGHASVWNGNYLGLVAARTRLHDPVVRQLDVSLYERLIGRPIDYDGFFPLVSSPGAFAVFENAYLFLFAELVLVIVALRNSPSSLTRFLSRTYLAYGLGLAIFAAWPVVGPPLYYPLSLRPLVVDSTTVGLMQGSLTELTAIQAGHAPSTGLAYFVGIPSLHGAMAVLFQVSLRPTRLLFWTVLPMNVLMIASTVVLGYHYIIDTVAGVALIPLVVAVEHAWLWVRRLHSPWAVKV